MLNHKRIRKIGLITSLVLLVALIPTRYPARAQEETHFEPGKWVGTFTFTFQHEWDMPDPEVGLMYNNYYLESEPSVGNLGFSVDQKGKIYGAWVRFPRIQYFMTAEQLVNWKEVTCKGYGPSGYGFARVSTITMGPLQRTASDTIITSPISLTAGNPYVEYMAIGSGCKVKETKEALRASIVYDLASMIVSPWVFHADSIADKLVFGGCSSEAWEV